jgi:chemotaxis protein histidine kinase CheA
MQHKTMANPISFRPAALVLLASLLVRPVFGGAYDDLVNAAGGNVPNVPPASGPVREDGEDSQARNEAEQERRQARAEAREAAREERARVREERAKARAIQKAKDDAEKQAKLEEAEEQKRLKAEQEQRTKAEAAERERQAVLKSQRAVAASQARATWDARDGDAYAGVFRDAPDNARREGREQTLARIAKLHSQIEATQNQFRQLNRDIQSDAVQFEVWEKASDEGIDNIWGIAGDMDLPAAETSLVVEPRQLNRRVLRIYVLGCRYPYRAITLINTPDRSLNVAQSKFVALTRSIRHLLLSN